MKVENGAVMTRKDEYDYQYTLDKNLNKEIITFFRVLEQFKEDVYDGEIIFTKMSDLEVVIDFISVNWISFIHKDESVNESDNREKFWATVNSIEPDINYGDFIKSGIGYSVEKAEEKLQYYLTFGY